MTPHILVNNAVVFETDIKKLSKTDLLALWRWTVDECMRRAKRDFEPETAE